MRRFALAALLLCVAADASATGQRRGNRWRRTPTSGGGGTSGLFPTNTAVFATVGVPGQSNDEGVNNQSATPVSTVAAVDVYVLCQSGATNLLELMDADSGTNCWPNREYPHDGLGDAIRAALPGSHTDPVFVIPCGVAGSPITNFWNVTAQANWTQCRTDIASFITEVSTNPGTYGLAASPTFFGLGDISAQGESDYAMATATYRTHLDGLLADYDAYIIAQTSQILPPNHVLEQPSAYTVSANDTPAGPVLAQIAKCRADSNVYCVGPTYAHEGENVTPWLHKQPANHRLSAELRGARLMATWGYSSSVLADAPLISSVTVNGTAATICFDQDITLNTTVDTPTLGTRTSAATANYGCTAHPGGDFGLEVLSTGTPPTLSGCAASGSDCVACTLSAALIHADDPYFAVAWSGTSPAAAFGCQGSANNAHSNIQSSATSLFANHSSCQFADGGTACVTSVDGGPPDSGPDAGVPDAAGMMVWMGASFISTANNYAPAITTTGNAAIVEPNPDAGAWTEATSGATAGDTANVEEMSVAAAHLLFSLGDGSMVVQWSETCPGCELDTYNEASTYYTNVINAVTEAIAVADTNAGQEVCVRGLVDQTGGYADIQTNVATPLATFVSRLEAHRTGLQADLEAIPGYPTTCGALQLFINTPGSFGYDATFGVASTDYTQGLLDEANTRANWHMCGSAFSWDRGADGLHLTGTGSLYAGEVYANCFDEVLNGGGTFDPLRVTAVAMNGSAAAVTVHVPCADYGGASHAGCVDNPPVSLNTTDVANRSDGDFGFRLVGDSNSCAIGTPTFDTCTSGTTCTIQVPFTGCGSSGAPTPGAELAVADNHPTSGSSGPLAAGATGSNLIARRNYNCDSYDAGVPDGASGQPCGDWAVGSRHTITGIDASTPDSGPDAGTPDSGPDAGPAPANFANERSINLDDSDDVITFTGRKTCFDNTAAFTVCWTDREGTRGVNEYVWGSYTTSNRQIAVYNRLTNYRFYLPNIVSGANYGVTNADSAGGPYANGEFIQTCWRYDGTQGTDATRSRVWVTPMAQPCNGACEETLTYSGGSVPATTTNPASGDFYFGAAISAVASWGSATSYFDEWACWSSALTVAQIEDEIMVGDAVDLNSLPTAGGPLNWYRFDDSTVDDSGTEGDNANTIAGTPTYPTTPQFRPMPNTHFYDPSANSDYLTRATWGGTSIQQCISGWFDIGNIGEAFINQWVNGTPSQERQWMGQNPTGTVIAAWGDGTTNAGRNFDTANDGAGNSAIGSGDHVHLAACSSSGAVTNWVNGARAEGGAVGTFVTSLAADRLLEIGQSIHSLDADEIVMSYGDVWTDAEACSIYCLTRTQTDPVSTTGQNGAPDCDCDAINIDEDDVCAMTGPTDIVWYKLDNDLTETCGGTTLTDQDTANYTSN